MIQSIKNVFPNQFEFKIVPIKTEGDLDLNCSIQALSKQSNQTGLFASKIESILLDDKIDCAVHSMKDLESELDQNLSIVAVLPREDKRDCLLSQSKVDLSNLVPRVISTGSVRRKSQLLRHDPNLTFRLIRGNIDTRIRKLCEGEDKHDIVVMAMSAIKRLNIDLKGKNIFCYPLNLDQFSTAVGQGAIAVECCKDNTEIISIFSNINDFKTQYLTFIERDFLNILDVGCDACVGIDSSIKEGSVHIRAMALSKDGTQCLQDQVVLPIQHSLNAGHLLAQSMISQGVKDILNA